MFHIAMDADPSKLEGSWDGTGQGYDRFVSGQMLHTRIGADVGCESVPLKIPEKLLFKYTVIKETERSMSVLEDSDETSCVDALVLF